MSELTKTQQERIAEILRRLADLATMPRLIKSDHYGRGLPMGWISPKGEFHEMGANDDHHVVIGEHTGVHPEDEDDYDTSKEHAYKNGWLSVGHSGELNFQGHVDVLKNHNHPAMKTMRHLATNVYNEHPDESHIEVYHFDPKGSPSVKFVETAHFVRHGTVKQDLSKSHTIQKQVMPAMAIGSEAASTSAIAMSESKPSKAFKLRRKSKKVL